MWSSDGEFPPTTEPDPVESANPVVYGGDRSSEGADWGSWFMTETGDRLGS